MRTHASDIALLVGEVLLAGCGLASLGGCIERGSVPVRDAIGEVRLGHGLGMDGKVPPGFGASRFAVGDPIHLSMWEKTDAPAGSMVRALVRDASDRIVWSEDKEVPRGGSYVSFGIGRTLARGRYRADVIVGQEVRSRTGFEVF